MKEEKSVGEQFCDALYEALAYSCKSVLKEDLAFPQEEFYLYSELFEHFELMFWKLKPFYDLLGFYDKLNPELVGFVITKDVDDLDLSWLDEEVLRKLKIKVDDEINKIDKYAQDKQ